MRQTFAIRSLQSAMRNPHIDKAHGSLAGVALGDALGRATEFLTREQIRESYGRVEGLVEPPPWHPHAGRPLGEVTDDTGQTLIIAELIISGQPLTPHTVGQTFAVWARESHASGSTYLGPSSRRALERLMAGEDPEATGRDGTTVGAAMRVAPVGIVHAGDLQGAVRDAVATSLPTHGTRPAISAAAAVACAIAEAMRPQATVDSVIAAAQVGAVRGREHGAWTWTPLLEKRIELAVRLCQEVGDVEEAGRILYEYIGVDMRPGELIPTAMGLIWASDGDPMTAIFTAVNMGGDTDTLAAVAGGICGALRGVEAVDRELLAEVERINGLDLAAVARRLVEDKNRALMSDLRIPGGEG